MTRRFGRGTVMAAALAGVLVGAALPVESRSAKARSSEGGHASSAGGVRVSGYARGGSVRVGGTATYGYGHGRYYGGYYGHHHHYPDYYWPYYWGWGWGWAWGAPRHYYSPVLVNVDPRRTPGVIETAVKPRKAAVVLDGEVVGQARDYDGKWDRLYVEPGSHLLEFQAKGRTTLRVRLHVRPGGRYRIGETLAEGEGVEEMVLEPYPRESSDEGAARGQPEPEAFRGQVAPESALARGLLRVSARPRDAAVYLDGEFLASADELSRLHGALPVAGGLHLLEVVRPGFVSQTREVIVEEGRPVRVEIELARE